jgi:hypothetical protein
MKKWIMYSAAALVALAIAAAIISSLCSPEGRLALKKFKINAKIALSRNKASAEGELLSLPRDDPDRKAYILKIKTRDIPAQLRERYDPLYEQLGLSETMKAKLNAAIFARDLIRDEIWSSDKNQIEVKLPASGPTALPNTSLPPNLWIHLGDGKELAAKFTVETEKIETEIRQMLGDAGYSLYKDYSATINFRGAVIERMQHYLSASGSVALDGNQINLLMDALVKAPVPASGVYAPSFRKISDEAVEMSRSFLSADQHDLLLKIQSYEASLEAAALEAVQDKMRR